MSQPPDQRNKGSSDDRVAGQKRVTHNQSTRADAGRDAAGRIEPRVEPALPQDLDESARSQASASVTHHEVGMQAMQDELSPSEDTDRGPVLDKVYNESIAPDRSEGPPRE